MGDQILKIKNCRKRTILNTSIFDFCSDIVANVPDPLTPETGDKPKRKRAPPKKKEKVIIPTKEGEGEEEEEKIEEDPKEEQE